MASVIKHQTTAAVTQLAIQYQPRGPASILSLSVALQEAVSGTG